MTTVSTQFGIQQALKQLKIKDINLGTSTGLESFANGKIIESYSPVNGQLIAKVQAYSKEDYERAMSKAEEAFKSWRMVPAPKRGEIVRQMGEELRKNKEALGMLVAYEMGKSLQEGLGEVQEMIDICDVAVGLSRQLYGLTMHSERPLHRMYEQWHPLGIVGVISAFNFPVAVWSWNAMVAAVCGNVVIWKGSEKTPLCSIAVQKIVAKVLKENNLPEGIFNLITGDREVGEWLTQDTRIPLISATGSTRMGKEVAKTVGSRLGKSILELGGNNAIIITENADLEMAVRATVFGAVGTCGQRCTSTRRLIIHESVYEQVKARLTEIYKNITIGDPLEEDTLVGPMIDEDAIKLMQNSLRAAENEGSKIIYGGEVLEGEGFYVRPALVEVEPDAKIIQEETFAPILYLIKYNTLEEAMAI